MIRFYDSPTIAPAPAPVPLIGVCPACEGNGGIGRLVLGPAVAEPVEWTTCTACSGSGAVAAEAVVHCAQPGCGDPIWADRACTHGTDSPLCGDHRPARCTGCIDEAGGLDR